MKKFFLVLAAFMLLAACAPAAQGGIQVEQAVVRLPGSSMAGMDSSSSLAGYMVIKNTGSSDDQLIAVQADFAGTSMLHQSSVDSNGVATMKMVKSINIPAGQTVKLQPGGFHVMFENLKKNLKAGDTVPLVLNFKNAGTIKVQAQVTKP